MPIFNLFRSPLPDHIEQAIKAVDWKSLNHAYGPAADSPGAFRLLASQNPRDRQKGYDHLAGSLYHQGTVYPATEAAVPILLLMVACEQIPGRDILLCALSAMFEGSGYYDAHSDLSIMGDTTTPEYQAKVAAERVVVSEIQQRILGERSSLLKLVHDKDWKVRASVLPLLQSMGEQMLPLWSGGLNKDESFPVRIIAARLVVAEQLDAAPLEIFDMLSKSMTDVPEFLLKQYSELSCVGDFTADVARALAFAGPDKLDACISKLVTDLERGGADVQLAQLSTLLHLVCLQAREVPFTNPESLTPLQARVVRECLRQMGLEMMPGLPMSSSFELIELLESWGLPWNEQALREYLTRVPS